MSEKLVELNKESFETFIAEKDVGIVDFYADWCAPCRMMASVLEKEENLRIGKVNVDNFPEIARKYNVTALPSLVFFKEGSDKVKLIGMQSIANVKKTYEELK